MKIIVPLDEDKTNVCQVFGRAPFFMTDDGNKTEILVNPAADAEGGAGLKAAQFAADTGSDALITFRCGENAAEVFKAAGMKIYKAEMPGVKENIAALKEGKLSELAHFHGGYHGIK